MSDKELKPCPKCRSHVEWEYTDWDEDTRDGDDGTGRIVCRCGIESPRMSKDEAEEWWNTRAAQVEAMGWRPIEEAPIGGGAETVVAPNWVEPPELLLLLPCGTMRIGNYEWYFSEGGYGYNGLSAWTDASTGDQLEAMYGAPPTHFIPLPQPPVKK